MEQLIMRSKDKPGIEFIPYKCTKCGLTFPFEKMTPQDIHFGNGSILTFYYCEKCLNEK